MSRYIDWKDVVNKYAMSAKATGGAEEMKISFVNASEDEVDARLAPRYTTPFTPVPGVVRDLCIDLAYYKMNIQQKTIKPLGDYIDKRFADILSGAILLTVSGTPLGQSDRGWSTTQGYGSSFGMDRTEDWRPDCQWIEDSRNRR